VCVAASVYAADFQEKAYRDRACACAAQQPRELKREVLVPAELGPLLQGPACHHHAAHVQIHDAVGDGFARGTRGLQSVGARVDGQRRAADDRAQLRGCPGRERPCQDVSGLRIPMRLMR
jgi:hypothetical protein